MTAIVVIPSNLVEPYVSWCVELREEFATRFYENVDETHSISSLNNMFVNPDSTTLIFNYIPPEEKSMVSFGFAVGILRDEYFYIESLVFESDTPDEVATQALVELKRLLNRPLFGIVYKKMANIIGFYERLGAKVSDIPYPEPWLKDVLQSELVHEVTALIY